MGVKVDITQKRPFAATPNDLVMDEKMTHWHIAVYTALARFADGDRTAFPGHTKLSKLLGCSRNKLMSVLEELKDAGWIDWQRRFDENTNTYHTNVYYLFWYKGGSAHSDLPSAPHALGGSAPHALGSAHSGHKQEPVNQEPRELEPVIKSANGKDPVLETYANELSALLPRTAWRDLQKQTEALHKLTKMTRDTQPLTPIDTPEEFAKMVVRVYAEMKQTGRGDYWKRAAFDPKGLEVRFTDVVTQLAEEYQRKQKEEEVYQRLYGNGRGT